MNNKAKISTSEEVYKRVSLISEGVGASYEEIKAHVNEDTLMVSADQAIKILEGKLYAPSNCYVCRTATIINETEISGDELNTDELSEYENKNKKKGCSVNYGLFVQGHFHRESGIVPSTTKATFTIVEEDGREKEVVAGGDAEVKYFDSLMIVDYSKQPDLDSEKTFGFYLYKPQGAKKEHIYLIRKSNNKTTLIKDGITKLESGAEYDEVLTKCKRHFVPMLSSNGGKKNTKAICINSSLYDDAKQTDLINKAMGGAYKEELERLVEKANHKALEAGEKPDSTLTLMETADLEPRTTLSYTQSIKLGTLGGNHPGTIMYIHAPKRTVKALLKEANNLDSEKMHIENDDKTTDGALELASEEFAYMMLVEHNILVNPNHLIGKDIQMRTDVYNIKGFGASEKAKRLRRIAKRLYKLCKKRGLDVHFHGKNPSLDNVVMIVDKDAAKLLCFEGIKKNAEVNVQFLAVAKANSVKTSNQVCSAILASPSIEQYVGKDTVSLHIEDELYDVLKEISKEDMINQINRLALSEFDIKGRSANPEFAANPELAVTDNFVLRRAYSSLVKNAEAAVTKGKNPTEGYTFNCLFDTSFSITGGLIRNILGVRTDVHAVEIYNKALLRDKADIIESIESEYDVEEAAEFLDNELMTTAFKYPACSVFENLLCRPKTEREIRYAADNIIAQFDKKTQKAEIQAVKDALEFILARGEGTIVIAPEDMVKQVWAGMDTDFDSLAVFSDKRLVDLMVRHKNHIDMMAVCTFIGSREAICEEELTPCNNDNTTSNISEVELSDMFNTVEDLL